MFGAAQDQLARDDFDFHIELSCNLHTRRRRRKLTNPRGYGRFRSAEADLLAETRDRMQGAVLDKAGWKLNQDGCAPDGSNAMRTVAGVGAICIGAALIEIGLIPGVVIGIVAALIPKYIPRIGNVVHPIVHSVAGDGLESGAATHANALTISQPGQDLPSIHLDLAPPQRPEQLAAVIGAAIVQAVLSLELPITVLLLLQTVAYTAQRHAGDFRCIAPLPSRVPMLASGDRPHDVGTAIGECAARALVTKLAGTLVANVVERTAPAALASVITRLLTDMVTRCLFAARRPPVAQSAFGLAF